MARAPHNRYPVGEGSLDKLLGVVCLKDLFLHLGDEGFDLRRLVAPAKFFHEGFEVYNALEQLRSGSKEALNITNAYLEVPYAENVSEINSILDTYHTSIMNREVTVEEGVASMNEQVGKILNQ